MSKLNYPEEFMNKVREKLMKNIGFSDIRKNKDTIEDIYIPLYCYLNSIYPEYIRLSALTKLPIEIIKDKRFNTFHFANFLCGLGLSERRKLGNVIYIRSIPLESIKTEMNSTEIVHKENAEIKKERRKPQEI
jgi:hypothetical protein